jgi:beta-N-acetylhexosaminidase
MIINNRRSFITGLKSTKLTKSEVTFLKQYNPWGVILFQRNISSINQVCNLTTNIKKIFKDKNYPILIDQEGGKVDRLKKIIDTSFFTSDFFGKLYKKDIRKFKIYYKIFIKQTSYLLNKIGVNINTVPVLDVRNNNGNKIIGNRSFGSNQKLVSKIGSFCISEFHANNIGTVIKHIPGHGLAQVDSHKNTPIVKKNLKQLNKIDFYPFKNQKSIFAMTAHIVYSKIDRFNTATHSKKIISLIRNNIKYKNLIISDDISMKSLKFSLKKNTINAFNAGCNLVLHCNGKLAEMTIVAKNSPIIDNFIIKKTSQFYKILR